MDTSQVIDWSREALKLTLLMGGPFLLVALGSAAPLAAVAAAPSGVAAADILPMVLDELRQAGAAPSVAADVVAVAAPGPAPPADAGPEAPAP